MGCSGSTLSEEEQHRYFLKHKAAYVSSESDYSDIPSSDAEVTFPRFRSVHDPTYVKAAEADRVVNKQREQKITARKTNQRYRRDLPQQSAGGQMTEARRLRLQAACERQTRRSDRRRAKQLLASSPSPASPSAIEIENNNNIEDGDSIPSTSTTTANKKEEEEEENGAAVKKAEEQQVNKEEEKEAPIVAEDGDPKQQQRWYTRPLLGPNDQQRACIINNPKIILECRQKFWGLGHQKWRENIDKKHWTTGRFVYDLCLHRGNGGRKEIGYLASMYDAWCFASAEIGRKSNADSWRFLNYFSMGHPGNHFFHGSFRFRGQTNYSLICKQHGMTEAAVDEFHREMPSDLCFIEKIDPKGKESEGGKYEYKRHMPGRKRSSLRNYVGLYIHQFYQAVGCTVNNYEDSEENNGINAAAGNDEGIHSSKTKEEDSDDTEEDNGMDASAAADDDNRQGTRSSKTKEESEEEEKKGEGDGDLMFAGTWPVPLEEVLLPALATLQQQLSRTEPSRDGNTRTLVVLVNKLLCDCGHHPAVFDFPDYCPIVTKEGWIQELRLGLQRWEEMVDILTAASSLRAEEEDSGDDGVGPTASPAAVETEEGVEGRKSPSTTAAAESSSLRQMLLHEPSPPDMASPSDAMSEDLRMKRKVASTHTQTGKEDFILWEKRLHGRPFDHLCRKKSCADCDDDVEIPIFLNDDDCDSDEKGKEKWEFGCGDAPPRFLFMCPVLPSRQQANAFFSS